MSLFSFNCKLRPKFIHLIDYVQVYVGRITFSILNNFLVPLVILANNKKMRTALAREIKQKLPSVFA
jgi:hypothetical protein